MGAGQSDLYKGTYGDKEGHLLDTSENRKHVSGN